MLQAGHAPAQTLVRAARKEAKLQCGRDAGETPVLRDGPAPIGRSGYAASAELTLSMAGAAMPAATAAALLMMRRRDKACPVVRDLVMTIL